MNHRFCIQSVAMKSRETIYTSNSDTQSSVHIRSFFAMGVALPSVDWSVTLPETIPFHEARNANVPLYVLGQPGSNNPALVTYGQFAKACRRVPRLLGFTKDFMAEKPVIAILANTDSLIYLTIMLGIILDGGIVCDSQLAMRANYDVLNRVLAFPYRA